MEFRKGVLAMAYAFAVRFVSFNGNYSLPVRFNDLEAARRCARRPDPCAVRFEICDVGGRCIEFDSY